MAKSSPGYIERFLLSLHQNRCPIMTPQELKEAERKKAIDRLYGNDTKR